MPAQNVIVIGASAGGIDALRRLLKNLPANIEAAIFAVIHIGQNASILPQIFNQSGVLPALHPVDGQNIDHGVVYIAPPDHHMIVEADHVHLSHGPKENLSRPAINPLFRSAALAYGPRVAGVVLTGLLDDGVSGLWEIKRRGGVTIVQDPQEAAYPSMPCNAIKHVSVDHVTTIAKMPALLANLDLANRTMPNIEENLVSRNVTDITCPECRGTLWEIRRGTVVDYACRVGHSFSNLGMASHHKEAEEKALWAAAVALEEGAVIDERLSTDASDWYQAQANKKREQASVIKKMILDLHVEATLHREDIVSADPQGGSGSP